MIASYKGPTFIPDCTCHKGWSGPEGQVNTALCLTVRGKACLLFSWPPLAFCLGVQTIGLGSYHWFIARWHIVSFLLPFDCVGFLEYCVENDGEVDRKECCAHLVRSPVGQHHPPPKCTLREGRASVFITSGMALLEQCLTHRKHSVNIC